MIAAGFQEEITKVEKGLCASCGKPVDIKNFKDNESVNEYIISGLCQSCQESVFEKKGDKNGFLWL